MSLGHYILDKPFADDADEMMKGVVVTMYFPGVNTMWDWYQLCPDMRRATKEEDDQLQDDMRCLAMFITTTDTHS